MNDAEFNEFKEYSKTKIETDFNEDIRFVPKLRERDELKSHNFSSRASEKNNFSSISDNEKRIKFIEEHHKLATMKFENKDIHILETNRQDFTKSVNITTRTMNNENDFPLINFKENLPKIDEIEEPKSCLKRYLNTTKEKAIEIKEKYGKRKLINFMRIMNVIFYFLSLYYS